MFEDEIWAVLRNVVLRNVDLKTALFQLVQSPTWNAMEELPPTDPSVTFFCRLKTTLVPMPSRQILPAPAASYPFSGPPIDIPPRQMLSVAASGEPAFLRPAQPMPSQQILPAPAASYTFSGPPIHLPSQQMLSAASLGEPAFLWPPRPILPLPLPAPVPSRPTLSISYAPTMPDFPIPESLPGTTRDATNDEDPSSTPGTAAGTLPSPIFGPLPVPVPSHPTVSVSCSPTMPEFPIPESLPGTTRDTTNDEDPSSTPGTAAGTLPSPIFGPLPVPVPSHPTVSVSCAPTMPDFPIPESLPGTTRDATNDEDPSSTPVTATGTLPSPILGLANEEYLSSFKDLDDNNDSDLSAPSPPDYDGGDDTERDHVMTGGRVSQMDATRTSSRIEQNRLEKLKGAAAKLGSPEPAGGKKGKGRKKGKKLKSKNAVESDEEDGEAVKTGDKRARPYKHDGVAQGKAGKRPRLDEGEGDSPDDRISEDKDGDGRSAGESENNIMFREVFEQDFFVGKFIPLRSS